MRVDENSMRAYRKIDEPYELKIEGGRLVLLGVGAVLTLVLVFLVGVLVGKGLWGAKGGGTTALMAASAPPAEPAKPQYTFYKDLTRPDGEVAGVQPAAPEKPEAGGGTPVSAPRADSTQAIVPPPSAAPSAAEAKPVTEAEPIESARNNAPTERAEPAKTKPTKTEPTKTESTKAAEPVKLARPAEPAKAPSPAKAVVAPKPVGATAATKLAPTKPDATKPEARLPAPSFTVQVGSFRDRASADEQAKKIIGQGVTAQVVLVSVEGRTWYRVQVGRFDTRADAEAHYQKKLRPKGVQGFVTAR